MCLPTDGLISMAQDAQDLILESASLSSSLPPQPEDEVAKATKIIETYLGG